MNKHNRTDTDSETEKKTLANQRGEGMDKISKGD